MDNPRLNIKVSVPIPNLPSPDFPVLPSWKYYYLSRKGTPTSLPNRGSSEDLQQSILAWYSCKNPENEIVSPYAHQGTQNSFLDPDSSETDWGIAFSLKQRMRQKPTQAQNIIPENLYPLLYKSNKVVDDYLNDIYLFPMHPDANPTWACQLVLDNNLLGMGEYFQNLGIKHLEGAPLGYYPPYYLFFLLTRFLSYPFSELQLRLIEIRKNSGMEQRKIIDSIFEIDNPEILKLVSAFGPEGWTSKAEEYLRFLTICPGSATTDAARLYNPGCLSPQPPESINYQMESPDITVRKMLNWSDSQILDLCSEKNLEVSPLESAQTREGWITEIVNMLRFYRPT